MVTLGENTFYTSTEVSNILRINPRTLQRWLTDEKCRPSNVTRINAVRAPNGRRMFAAREVHTILEKCYRITVDDAVIAWIHEVILKKRQPKVFPRT
jgi:hypothetical protein